MSGLLNANRAKEIADKSKKLKIDRNLEFILHCIGRSAQNHNYKTCFHDLDLNVVRELQDLGYVVKVFTYETLTVYEVSWK